MTGFLAFDIGCIECGESSAVIGVYPTQTEAQVAADAAEQAQQADWHGQHYMAVYDLATGNEVTEP